MIVHHTMENGFEYLEIRNDSATAKIALQGAHLFYYARHGDAPLLWVSRTSAFEAGEAIRGGVPLYWPWFGQHQYNTELPQHGFARTARFEQVGATETEGATSVTFCLRASAESMLVFPYAFELQYTVRVAQTLTLELTTYNRDTRAFSLTQALHSYFAVSDIANIHVTGLEGLDYIDYVNAQRREHQDGSVVIAQEVDRVYEGVVSPVVLVDATRRIGITNTGSRSVVVWNPWIEKGARMRAMEPTGYRNMLCIESANALCDARTIAPEQHHTLTAVISSTIL